MPMRIIRYLPLAGLLLFGYILSSIGIGNIAKALAAVKPFYFVAALLTIPLIILIKGFKWHLIIRAHGLNYSLIDSCSTNLIGAYLGIITPGRIGEIMRVFYLKEKTGNFPVSLLTVFIDRFFDLLTILFFGIIGGFLLSRWLDVKIAILSYPVLFVLFFVLIAPMLKAGYAKTVAKPLFDFFTPERYKPQLRSGFNDVNQGLKTFTRSKREIFIVAIVAMFAWIVEVVQAYFLALSLDLAIPFVFIFAISPFVTLIVLAPISISGLGTREALLIYLLSLLGISADRSVAFSLVAFLTNYVSYAILGLVLWMKKPLRTT